MTRLREDSRACRVATFTARPRRMATATIRPGLRVSAKFMQNGREKLFGGVIVARSVSGWKVRFDDGEERAMQEQSLTAEAGHSLPQEMAGCLTRLRELRGHMSSASVCRAFALDLERLQAVSSQ